MSKMDNKILMAVLGIGLAVSSTHANPVTFADYAGVFPYAEDGFIVTPTATPNGGAWGITAANTISTAMSLTKRDLTQTYGQIEITRAGGELFYFNSVSVVGLNTPSTPGASFSSFVFYVDGFLNGAVVFDTFVNATGLKLILGNPSIQMDTLLISANFGGTASLGTSSAFSVNGQYIIQNIDVTAATSTPDVSSTVALLGMSASALFLFGRKFRTAEQTQP